MPNIRWKVVGLVLLAAFFAYMGLYLLAPGHVVKSYTQWGYRRGLILWLELYSCRRPSCCRFAEHAGPALSSHAVCWRWLRRLALSPRLRSRRSRPTAHRPDRLACSRPTCVRSESLLIFGRERSIEPRRL